MIEQINYQVIPENISNIEVLSFHIKLSSLKLRLQIKHKLLKSVHKETDEIIKEVLKTVFYMAYVYSLCIALRDEISDMLPKPKLITDGFITKTDRLLN